MDKDTGVFPLGERVWLNNGCNAWFLNVIHRFNMALYQVQLDLLI